MAVAKFSIHSIIGDSMNTAGMTHMNGSVMPHTALTSAMAASTQEAAMMRAVCNGYAPNVMQCPTSNTAPVQQAPPLPAAAPAPQQPSGANGMGLAITQASNQYNPAGTTATLIRPPGSSPITWQPLTFYPEHRWAMPQQQSNGVAEAPMPAPSTLPSYQPTATAHMPTASVGCYGYDASAVMGMPGGQRSHVTHYSMGHLKLKKKKTRTVFTRSQIDQLEVTFNQKRYLSSNDRLQLALSLKMTETQVKVWFQNRRNKWKREIASSTSQRPGSADSQSVISGMEKSSTTTSETNDMLDHAEDSEECSRVVSSSDHFSDLYSRDTQQQQLTLSHQPSLATNSAHNPSGATRPVQIIPVACR